MSSIEIVYLRAKPITDTLKYTKLFPKLNLKSKSNELDQIVSEISQEAIEELLSLSVTSSQSRQYNEENSPCEIGTLDAILEMEF